MIDIIVSLLLLFVLFIGALAILKREGACGTQWNWTVPVVLLAFVLRFICLNHVTYDYIDFLSQWVAYFRANGGFSAIADSVGNYNVPYLYFLAAISYLPISDLYLIKLCSIIFDVLLAWGGLRLVRCGTGRGGSAPGVAFCVLMFLPTVVLNGAYWGQCDSIYVALCLHALACALTRSPKLSVVLLAVAFSFKLQTIFLIPMWCAFWFLGKVNFRNLLLFPITYVVTILPALFLGKPLGDILGVYVGQTTEYTTQLTYNAPSIYALLPYQWQGSVADTATGGIILAFGLVVVILLVLLLFRKKVTTLMLITASALMALGVPFFLPYMHERYFMLADVLTVVLACIALPYLFTAILVQLASLSTYCAYLRLQYTAPLYLGGQYYLQGLEALFMGLSLIALGIGLILQILGQRRKKCKR